MHGSLILESADEAQMMGCTKEPVGQERRSQLKEESSLHARATLQIMGTWTLFQLLKRSYVHSTLPIRGRPGMNPQVHVQGWRKQARQSHEGEGAGKEEERSAFAATRMGLRTRCWAELGHSARGMIPLK